MFNTSVRPQCRTWHLDGMWLVHSLVRCLDRFFPFVSGCPLTWETSIVREFQSGQWKVRENDKVRGNWNECHCTVQLPVTQVLILESLTVSFCTCYRHNAWNVGIVLSCSNTVHVINVSSVINFPWYTKHHIKLSNLVFSGLFRKFHQIDTKTILIAL